MVVDYSALTSGTDTNDTDLVTASVAPSGHVVLTAVLGGSDSVPSISGLGLTWTLIDQTNSFSSRILAWIGTGTPSSGSITVTKPGGETWSMKLWSVVELSGDTGNIIQSNTDITDADPETHTINFGSAMASGNGAFAAFGHVGGAYPSTPATGWTEQHNPTIGGEGALASHTRPDTASSATADYGGSTVSVSLALIAEIEAAGGGMLPFNRRAMHGGIQALNGGMTS